MEIKIILSPEEQNLLGVDVAEFSEDDAVHLLFGATALLERNGSRMEQLRGHAPGERGQLNVTWHINSVLSDLVDGLNRVTGT